MEYDQSTNTIKFIGNTQVGTYKLNFILTDDRNSQNKYEFTFQINEPINQDEIVELVEIIDPIIKVEVIENNFQPNYTMPVAKVCTAKILQVTQMS